MRKARPQSERAAFQAGQRVLLLREPGESYSRFAKRVGLPPQTINNYYRKESGASVDAVATVVANTNVNARWLLTGMGRRLEPSGDIDPRAYEQALRLLLKELRADLDAFARRHRLEPEGG